jgi:hypothetical protein
MRFRSQPPKPYCDYRYLVEELGLSTCPIPKLGPDGPLHYNDNKVKLDGTFRLKVGIGDGAS